MCCMILCSTIHFTNILYWVGVKTDIKVQRPFSKITAYHGYIIYGFSKICYGQSKYFQFGNTVYLFHYAHSKSNI